MLPLFAKIHSLIVLFDIAGSSDPFYLDRKTSFYVLLNVTKKFRKKVYK